MTAQRVGRMIVALASVAFAGVAVTLWAAPVRAAHALGLEAVRSSGVAVLRADLGGLFAAFGAVS